MHINIKKLDDIVFLSAKIDKRKNIIHIQARNQLDFTGTHCTNKACNGTYIAHGFTNSVYEDLHIDGYRVFIHLKTRRAYCPKCGSVIIKKPDCLSRKITLMDENADSGLGNYRMTNRFLSWVEHLIFKYGIDIASEISLIKTRRLYYIRRAYREQQLNMHITTRSLVIAKSRHNGKNLYLIIDTMHDDRLLNYVDSPKKAFESVCQLKQNNPTITEVVIPAGFKYKNELVQLFGEDNVKYDFRSLQTMITNSCFGAYKKQCQNVKNIDVEEYLFSTPRTQLTRAEQSKLDYTLRTNQLFHDFYYLQQEYWYSLDDKVGLNVEIKTKNKDLNKLQNDLKLAKSHIDNKSDKSIESALKTIDTAFAHNESKDYVLYKQRMKDSYKNDDEIGYVKLNLDDSID